jgi:hypothetical protein
LPRPFHDEGNLLLEEAFLRPVGKPPFLIDDGPFAIDLGGVQDDAGRPVLQHGEGGIHGLRIVRHRLQGVDRPIEGRGGVDFGTEAHAQGLELDHQIVLGEALGAVEGHVLEEVREAELGIVLIQ